MSSDRTYPYIVEEREDGSKRYCFDYHPGQRQAWESKARYILVLAGTQGGKTTFAPWWLLREIIKCGPGNYLYVSPTHTGMNLQSLPAFLYLYSNTMDLGKYHGQKHIFTFSDDGMRFLFGDLEYDVPVSVHFGYASKPQSLESITAKAAVLDECGQSDFKRGSFEAIERRLLIHRGRILMTTTPYSYNWLKHDIFDKKDDPDADIDVIQFHSLMNPRMPPEVVESARQRLPKHRFEMFYEAKFTRPSGQIYSCFDNEEHVMQRIRIPDSWNRYVGVDFGGSNQAAVYLAEEEINGKKTGRFYLYRTYLAGDKTFAQHVQHMLGPTEGIERIYEADGVEGIPREPRNPIAWGGAWSETQERREFSSAGLDCERPDNQSVEVQIERTYSMITEGKLLIFSDLKAIINDLNTYSREVGDDGAPTERIKDKSKYHLLDCLRYVCTSIVAEQHIPIKAFKGSPI